MSKTYIYLIIHVKWEEELNTLLIICKIHLIDLKWIKPFVVLSYMDVRCGIHKTTFKQQQKSATTFNYRFEDEQGSFNSTSLVNVVLEIVLWSQNLTSINKRTTNIPPF